MPSHPGSPKWPTVITALIQEIPSPVAFPRPRQWLRKICLQMPMDKTKEDACPRVSAVQRIRSAVSPHLQPAAHRSGRAPAASRAAAQDGPLPTPAAPAPHPAGPPPGTPAAGPALQGRAPGPLHGPPAIPPNPAKKALEAGAQRLAGAPVTPTTALRGTVSTSTAPVRRSHTGSGTGSAGAPIPP